MDEALNLDALFWVYMIANRAGQRCEAAGLPSADCYLTSKAAGKTLDELLSLLPYGIGHARFEGNDFVLRRCEGTRLSIKTVAYLRRMALSSPACRII